MDNGLVTVVDVNQLLTLPEQFLIVPPLVVEVIVCGLQPMDRDIYWSPKVSCSYSALVESHSDHSSGNSVGSSAFL